MNEQNIIVIDIGGTYFRIGVYNKKIVPYSINKIETPNFINNSQILPSVLPELLINKICEVVKKYGKRYKSSSVGLSFPGPIDGNGIVHGAATVWGDKISSYPILKSLSKKMPFIKWTVANDITAAAERYGGMNKYRKNSYLGIITVSSGIGNKIYDIRSSKVILDKKGIGGELGHVRFDFSKKAPLCDCGNYGHIGALSSGRAVERKVKLEAKKNTKKYRLSYLHKIINFPEDIDNKKIILAAKNDDKFVLDILEKTTFPIAYSIAYLSGTIGVDKFIIIGGFALNLGEIYLTSLRKNFMALNFYNREDKEINNLIELGINDDCDCLIGIGLLAKKN